MIDCADCGKRHYSFGSCRSDVSEEVYEPRSYLEWENALTPRNGRRAGLRGGSSRAVRTDDGRDPEEDRSQRNWAPPVLPESGQAMAAFPPRPKGAEHDKRRTEQQADALHSHSLPREPTHFGAPEELPID